jgi:acetyltransferase-like isoleucine patch superfamily enzyme
MRGRCNSMLKRVLQRVFHTVACNGPGGGSLQPWLHRQRGVEIGSRVWISRCVYIGELHLEAVSIGDSSTVGLLISIFTHFYWGCRRSAANGGPVSIGRDVFIGHTA